jgi:hypothetical protein
MGNKICALSAAWLSGCSFFAALTLTLFGVHESANELIWLSVILYFGAIFHIYLAGSFLSTVKQTPNKKSPIERPNDNSQQIAGSFIPTENGPPAKVQIPNDNCEGRAKEKNNNISDDFDNSIDHKHAPSCGSVTCDREHSIAEGAPEKRRRE